MEEKQGFFQKRLSNIRRQAEERDAQKRASRLGYPYVDLRKMPVSLEALKLTAESESRGAQAVPLEANEREIALAFFNPGSENSQKLIKSLESQKYKIKIFIASLSGLDEFRNSYKLIPPPAKEITGMVEIGKKRLEELATKLTDFQKIQNELKNVDFQNLTTTDLLEIILAGAIAVKASDVHLEALDKSSKIRFRLDGVLHDIFRNIPPRNYGSLTSRIKLLSGLKINIHDEAQDGRFTIKLFNKELEVRVSIIPSEYGETAVLRLLDPETISVSLSSLGLREDDLTLVKKELERPNGLILNTGPTGSGKTTTLYAFLRTIVSPEIKIITIEDPIEYRLEGIEQTQVDPEAGYNFASGLRSILRQDPDVILVGEIRDLETADIALQASLTGHLVFSTLHTNDAVGAVPRLLDLGVKPIHIGPALNLIIAQRLVRLLCADCRKPTVISLELKSKIKKFLDSLPKRINKKPYENFQIYTAGGCAACNGIGYKGRSGIFEFLQAGAEFEEAILKEASEVSLKRLAEKQQMASMQADGILKVLSGQTDFAEVERITGPVEWG